MLDVVSGQPREAPRAWSLGSPREPTMLNSDPVEAALMATDTEQHYGQPPRAPSAECLGSRILVSRAQAAAVEEASGKASRRDRPGRLTLAR